MEINIPFSKINWNDVVKTEYTGETGTAYWQSVELNGIRIRIVEYTRGYVADHWCKKGHIVHCIEGSFISKLKTGEETIFNTGMSYIVSDNMSEHLSVSNEGAKLLIIDGMFLKFV